MEIPIDEDWLKALYDILVKIYSDTDRPIVSGFPIVTDYDEGLLSVCVERGKTTILWKSVYPHSLQRAAVLMHSIINFHPFVDGNKRAALLATNFYLHWNGYKLVIPSNADDFTIDVAKGKFGLNDVLIWLRRNTVRTPFTVLRHWFCETEILEHPHIHSEKT
jgi:death-on-curing protein